MSANRVAKRILAAMLLAVVCAGAARGEEEVAAAAAREPTLRKIHMEVDAEAKERIEHFRARLPAELRRMNNFAWAKAEIKGLRKKEYFAHSRIQGLGGLSWGAARKIRSISPKPDAGAARFETLIVDYLGNVGGPNAIPRWFDTEYKILEDVAARLPDPSAAGNILLYTDLEPCPSCRGVMRQFLAAYTNVEMEVIYAWP